MTDLNYRSFAEVDALAVNDCTIHSCSGGPGGNFWHMWFRVLRETDGQPDVFCVPVAPNNAYNGFAHKPRAGR